MTEKQKETITTYCINNAQIPCLFAMWIMSAVVLFTYMFTKSVEVVLMVTFILSVGISFWLGRFIKKDIHNLFFRLGGFDKIYWEENNKL